MHSELIAVAANGQVYQWKWIDIEPYKHPDVSFDLQYIFYKNNFTK
jgi:hypothetical protein